LKVIISSIMPNNGWRYGK